MNSPGSSESCDGWEWKAESGKCDNAVPLAI
jgi:hypothetical protein